MYFPGEALYSSPRGSSRAADSLASASPVSLSLLSLHYSNKHVVFFFLWRKAAQELWPQVTSSQRNTAVSLKYVRVQTRSQMHNRRGEVTVGNRRCRGEINPDSWVGTLSLSIWYVVFVMLFVSIRLLSYQNKSNTRNAKYQIYSIILSTIGLQYCFIIPNADPEFTPAILILTQISDCHNLTKCRVKLR